MGLLIRYERYTSSNNHLFMGMEQFNSKSEGREPVLNMTSADELIDRLTAELTGNGSLSYEDEEALAEKIQDLLEVQKSLSGAEEQQEVNSRIAQLKNIQIMNEEGSFREAA